MKHRRYSKLFEKSYPKREGEPMPPEQVNVPFASVAGFEFRLDLFAAADLSDYEAGKGDRIIILYLMGEVQHAFTGPRADEFYVWYLALTGRNAVRLVHPEHVT